VPKVNDVAGSHGVKLVLPVDRHQDATAIV
jgi:hypothetical protein